MFLKHALVPEINILTRPHLDRKSLKMKSFLNNISVKKIKLLVKNLFTICFYVKQKSIIQINETASKIVKLL